MNESGTALGSAIICPGCKTEAWLVPHVEYLQGVGEGGLVRYTHEITRCLCPANADNTDVLTRG